MNAVCEIMEKLNEEAITERNREVALKLIEIVKLSYEEIAQSSNLSVEEVKALAEGKTAYGLMRHSPRMRCFLQRNHTEM